MATRDEKCAERNKFNVDGVDYDVFNKFEIGAQREDIMDQMVYHNDPDEPRLNFKPFV